MCSALLLVENDYDLVLPRRELTIVNACQHAGKAFVERRRFPHNFWCAFSSHIWLKYC